MSAHATITTRKPSITIEYVEPSTLANGQPLTTLAKTTIYRDLGTGIRKYKDIPASSPRGGGTVIEHMTVPVKPGEIINATICVTATNTGGLEG